MKVRDSGTRWSPNVAPTKPDDLPDYLFHELTSLSRALFQVEGLHINRQYKLPKKPRDGDLALGAAGVFGPAAGLYYYNGIDWIFVA